MANTLPDLTEARQHEVVDFLVAQDTPLTRELLVSIASDDRLPEAVRKAARPRPSVRATPEDPEERIVEGRPKRDISIPRTIVKKRETTESSFLTMPTILAGGVTVVLLVLLLVEILRKG
jgi:hypothetical protein